MKLFGKILLLVVMMPWTVKAQVTPDMVQKCQKIYQQKKPEYKITYNYGALKYDVTKSSEQLAKIYNEINPKNSTGNIQGLTYLAPYVVTMTKVMPEILGDNVYCMFPEKIDVKIWYEPVVYLVNSLEQGSCQFNVTVRHEQTHLDLGHYALYKFAHTLDEAMPQIIAAVKPRVVTATSFANGNVVKDITDDYQDKVKVYFDSFKSELEKQNAILDAKENYRQEGLLCR